MRANPRANIGALDSLDFVMKDGMVYRDDDKRLGKDLLRFWLKGDSPTLC
jgi:hypothetical protein